VNGCLSLYVSPAIDWQPVEGVRLPGSLIKTLQQIMTLWVLKKKLQLCIMVTARTAALALLEDLANAAIR